jgi:diguanylate cyclase (GGDEF)-like protein
MRPPAVQTLVPIPGRGDASYVANRHSALIGGIIDRPLTLSLYRQRSMNWIRFLPREIIAQLLAWRPTLFGVQIAALAVLSLLLIAVSVNANRAADARDEAEAWYMHTLNVLLESSRLREGVYSELRGERGYLLTHDRTFLNPFFAGRDAVLEATALLDDLTIDDPEQIIEMHRLSGEMRSYEGLLHRTIGLEQLGYHERAVSIVRAGIGRRHVDAVLGTIGRIDDEEKMVFAERRQRVQDAMAMTDRAHYLLSVVGFLLVGLSLWTAFTLRRLQALAVKLNADLEYLASSDGLTGLANRRAFFNQLERDQTGERASAVAILDVDHFKRVNDAYGHPVGDRLLREIATVLSRSVRGTDTVGRIGGEEFAILMPDTTENQAMQACERARAAVDAHVVKLTNDNDLHVSISIGVAIRAHADTSESWINKADQALYRAKEAGRNRVLLAA